MKISRKLNIQDEIDLFDIARTIYKNKFLILIFCLIGTVSSFFLSKAIYQIKPEYSISEIKITKIPNGVFDIYENLIPNSSNVNINLYNDEFINLINSKENLADYFDSYGKELINIIGLNKKFIENDKIFFAGYFFDKISKIDEAKKVYLAKFIFDNNDIDGQKFLNHYFDFTIKRTNSYSAKYLINMINDYLIFSENQRELAKKLNLVSPDLQNNNIISEKDKMIYVMSLESINSRIDFLISMKKKLSENELLISKYFKISVASTPTKINSPNRIQMHMQIGFVISLLLSLIVIFLKTTIKS
jgi:LPS O-antigen subunit length determinant protein (WzzB/FepE family)